MIVAAALLALVAGIVIFRPHAGSTAAAGTAPSPSSQDARRQAAVGLSGLLAQSVTDRAAVTDAAEDVRGCGPSLRQDAQTFARAASSRQHLLSRLASLPGRSELPPALLQNLTTAWQASAQVIPISPGGRPTRSPAAATTTADPTPGCGPHRPREPATAGKHAFARLWNPVARGNGLTTYQPSQL